MLEYVALSQFNSELILCCKVGLFAPLHTHMDMPSMFVYIYTAVCLSLVIIMLYEANFCFGAVGTFIPVCHKFYLVSVHIVSCSYLFDYEMPLVIFGG